MISRLDITCIRMKGWVIQMFCGPYFIFGQVVQFSSSIFHHSFLKNTCFFSANQQEVHLCLIKLSRGHKEVQGVGGSEKLTSSSPVGALVPSERLNSTSEAWHFRLLQPWLVDVKFRWNQACWCLCHPSVTWQGLVEKAGSEVQQTHKYRMYLGSKCTPASAHYFNHFVKPWAHFAAILAVEGVFVYQLSK